jgi:hypothetical protein
MMEVRCAKCDGPTDTGFNCIRCAHRSENLLLRQMRYIARGWSIFDAAGGVTPNPHKAEE